MKIYISLPYAREVLIGKEEPLVMVGLTYSISIIYNLTRIIRRIGAAIREPHIRIRGKVEVKSQTLEFLAWLLSPVHSLVDGFRPQNLSGRRLHQTIRHTGNGPTLLIYGHEEGDGTIRLGGIFQLTNQGFYLVWILHIAIKEDNTGWMIRVNHILGVIVCLCTVDAKDEELTHLLFIGHGLN